MAPLAPISNAKALPIPEEAPVITTTLSFIPSCYNAML
jgi:hypothetical protein